MTVDSSIWGEPKTLYDTMNTRTGASDLDDSDFTDYPPFVKNDFSALGSNPTGGVISDDSLYIAYLNDGQNKPSGFWNFNHPLDLTIAYTACSNHDLPLNDIGAVGTDTFAEPIGDGYNFLPPRQNEVWTYVTKDGDAQPIVFINSYSYMTERPNTLGSDALTGVLYNPLYSNTYPPKYLYYQGGEYDSDSAGWDTNSKKNKININLYMSYWRDFGIRSLFGVIMLYYFDGTYNNNTGVPQNINLTPVSLHWYETQTDLWKHGHPIIAAYLDIYIRSNIDGTYSNSRRLNQVFTLDVTSNLRFNDKWGTMSGNRIMQPIASYHKNSKNYLPLLGYAPAGAGVNNTPNVLALIGNQKLDGTGGVNSTSGIILGRRFVKSGFKNETTSTAGLKTFWTELEGDKAENLELLRKTAAGYGLFFADDVYNLADSGRDADRWTDENMCLGVVHPNGYTDGTYTKGSGNEGANNYLWRTASDTTYNPSKPPPTPDNQYSDSTVFNQIGDLATMFKRYVISASEVETLGKDLFKITDDLAVASPSYDDYATEVNSSFLVSNPLDCIISLRRFPMEIPKDGTYTNIKLGTHTITTCGYGMEKTAYTYLFEMSNPIYPNFGDSFLDYEPFTDYELYVPFCGTVKLNPRDIIGRKLAVQLVVDFTTGTATGFVMSDNLVIETVNGNIAIDIPVTGLNSATIASQLNNAIAQRETSYYSKMSQGFETAKSFLNPLKMGGAVGNLAKSINAETSHQLADYNLQHQEATPHTIGAATPVGLWAIDLNCRLICYFPTGEVITSNGQTPKLNSKIYDFGATQGFATVETSTIGSYTGLVIASNPLTGGFTTQSGMALTDTEIQGIISDLAEGVIV